MNTRKVIIGLVLLGGFVSLAIFALGRTQLKPRSQITLIIVFALIFWIVMRKGDWTGKIDQALFAPTDIDHSCGEAKVSESRKDYLKDVASRLYDDIYDTSWFGHDCSLYTEANGLCDEELVYVAEYYKKYLTSGTSIYNDLAGWNGEFTVFCSFSPLMQHLSKIGQRS